MCILVIESYDIGKGKENLSIKYVGSINAMYLVFEDVEFTF